MSKNVAAVAGHKAVIHSSAMVRRCGGARLKQRLAVAVVTLRNHSRPTPGVSPGRIDRKLDRDWIQMFGAPHKPRGHSA